MQLPHAPELTRAGPLAVTLVRYTANERREAGKAPLPQDPGSRGASHHDPAQQAVSRVPQPQPDASARACLASIHREGQGQALTLGDCQKDTDTRMRLLQTENIPCDIPDTVSAPRTRPVEPLAADAPRTDGALGAVGPGIPGIYLTRWLIRIYTGEPSRASSEPRRPTEPCWWHGAGRSTKAQPTSGRGYGIK